MNRLSTFLVMILIALSWAVDLSAQDPPLSHEGSPVVGIRPQPNSPGNNPPRTTNTTPTVAKFDAVMKKIFEQANRISNKNELANSRAGLSMLGTVKDGTLWITHTNLPREQLAGLFAELENKRITRRRALSPPLPQTILLAPVGTIPASTRIESLIYGGLFPSAVGELERALFRLVIAIRSEAGGPESKLLELLTDFNKQWVSAGLFTHAMLDSNGALAIFVSDEVDETTRAADFHEIWARENDDVLDPNLPPLTGDQAYQNLDNAIPVAVRMTTLLVNGVDCPDPLALRPAGFDPNFLNRLDGVINAFLTLDP